MFTLGTDGVEQEVKLPTPADFADGVWSNDGRNLILNEYRDATGGSNGILDLASDRLTPIGPKDLANGLDCSDWSPDGRSLVCAYGSPANVRDGIYLVDVASGTAKRLSKSPYHDTVGTLGECGGGENRGVFSPDGSRIAYEQQKCGTGADPSADEEGDIVIIPTAGGKPRVVVPLGGVKTHPGGEISWSPDGRFIAFGTQDGQLSIVAPDGSGLRQLPLPATLSERSAFGPAWSPDGKWLLAAFGSGGGSDLYAVAADGFQAIQLTSTSLTEAYTDWGPAAP
jgi:Tol biopolymer transport system component